jgi:peptidoglycan/xylan/chitin deacetylase (PgdA/CDA1 family)
VFTVDDGYADFADIASPVFAAYDCPVTVFLITDFVSGRLWNWFDKVGWVFRESIRDTLNFEIAAENLGLHWKTEVERELVSEVVIERLKQIPDSEKEERIRALARALEVELPEEVPSRDRAMTWDQVRQCARKGATFGPHTVTHPILSRVDARRADAEISQSWRAVTSATEASVPVFCYPNGTAADFSSREERSVESAGMKAALSAIPGSVISTASGMKVTNRFSIPRFSYVEDKSGFVRIVTGLEEMRAGIT